MFTVNGGPVFVVDPGTGPADPPRIVKSFEMPGVLVNAGIFDSEGYLWLATPDLTPNGGPFNRAFIVDPHEGVIHRVIELPPELRAVADLSIGPDRVYLRAWRDGFSGGVGTVPRVCVADASHCSATLFTELGDVGLTPERAFHLTPSTLFSFSNPNSRDQRSSIDAIDPQTGEIRATTAFSGNLAFDDRSLYAIGQFIPGRNELLRLDQTTLAETGRTLAPDGALIAVQAPFIYTADYRGTVVEVFSTEALEPVRTYDVSGSGGAQSTFAFVAPDVLMLNGNVSLSVSTGELLRDPANVAFGASTQAIRLPEGHPSSY